LEEELAYVTGQLEEEVAYVTGQLEEEVAYRVTGAIGGGIELCINTSTVFTPKSKRLEAWTSHRMKPSGMCLCSKKSFYYTCPPLN
jgi:hypothetical protein